MVRDFRLGGRRLDRRTTGDANVSVLRDHCSVLPDELHRNHESRGHGLLNLDGNLASLAMDLLSLFLRAGNYLRLSAEVGLPWVFGRENRVRALL